MQTGMIAEIRTFLSVVGRTPSARQIMNAVPFGSARGSELGDSKRPPLRGIRLPVGARYHPKQQQKLSAGLIQHMSVIRDPLAWRFCLVLGYGSRQFLRIAKKSGVAG